MITIYWFSFVNRQYFSPLKNTFEIAFLYGILRSSQIFAFAVKRVSFTDRSAYESNYFQINDILKRSLVIRIVEKQRENVGQPWVLNKTGV